MQQRRWRSSQLYTDVTFSAWSYGLPYSQFEVSYFINWIDVWQAPAIPKSDSCIRQLREKLLKTSFSSALIISEENEVWKRVKSALRQQRNALSNIYWRRATFCWIGVRAICWLTVATGYPSPATTSIFTFNLVISIISICIKPKQSVFFSLSLVSRFKTNVKIISVNFFSTLK